MFDAGIALGTRRFACSARHGRERILHQNRCPAGKAIHQSRSHRVPPLVQFLCALLLTSERVRSKWERRGQSQVSERYDHGIPGAFGADMAGDAAFIAEVRYIGDGLNRPDQNRFCCRARSLVRSGDKVASNGRRFQRGRQTRCLFRIVQHGRPAQNRFQ